MGIINQGILGAVRKKVGNVVGASWKGIPVLKIYQPVVSNPKTAAQVTVRTGFKAFAQLASLILASYIKPLWDRNAVRMSGYNAFMKANAEFIADGSSPFDVEFVATKGKMDATAITSGSASASGITLNWDSSATSRYALPEDKPYVLALNVTQGTVAFAGLAGSAAKRSDGTVTIAAAALMNAITSGDDLDVYLSFQRSDATIVSDSDSATITAA